MSRWRRYRNQANILLSSDQPFLKLQNAGVIPNIFQAHALKVLSHTFPLLSLPIPQSSSTTSTTIHHAVPREVNQLLQQLGLPPLRVQNGALNQNRGNVLIRDINLRPLLGPFMMLIIRTLLLVYFVSPARKPVFGILVGAWILYEAWGPIRAAMGDRHGVPGVNAAPRQGEAAPMAPAGPVQHGVAQVRPQGQGAAPRLPDPAQHVNQAEALIEGLANINIPAEEEALVASERASPAEEPGLAQKVTAFLSLFVLTLHPAVWNRRRVLLRQREGRIRIEANAREREPDPPSGGGEQATTEVEKTERERVAGVRAELVAQHARRPRWVQAYVDRVRMGEWVDD